MKRDLFTLAPDGVPCDGCTRCCHGDAVRLLDSDDLSKYQTEPHPYMPKVLVVAHKPNGDCLYLGDEGCTIHDTKPQMCREMDCRRIAMAITWTQARKAAAGGVLRMDVWRRGKELLARLERIDREDSLAILGGGYHLEEEVTRRSQIEAEADKVRGLTEAQVTRILRALAEDVESLDRDRLKDFVRGLLEKVEIDLAASTFQISYRLSAGDRVASPRLGQSIPGVLMWFAQSLRAA